jgi:hypothetical protein
MPKTSDYQIIYKELILYCGRLVEFYDVVEDMGNWSLGIGKIGVKPRTGKKAILGIVERIRAGIERVSWGHNGYMNYDDARIRFSSLQYGDHVDNFDEQDDY